MAELPAMASLNYSSTTSTAADLMANMAVRQQRVVDHDVQQLQRRVAFQGAMATASTPVVIGEPKGEIEMSASTRRLVQVFIADTDENVPLTDCLLYSGDQKLTDLNDQELFFELDIKSIMDKHNEKRIKLINKTVKERTEYLEPVRIRDLKMTVVTIASF